LKILADISLAIHESEIVCMVGESGSGKSTFGRTLVGLMKSSGGDLLLDGEALPDHSSRSFARLRATASLLFQDPVTSFDPRQRIRSIIAEPRRIAGQGSLKSDAIIELAAQAGLSRNLLARFPHGLSGGQARRAAVARALSVVPRLIIADEPTAGLDLSVQGGILNLFLDIRDAHKTAFLIITHNLAVARHVSDRVAIMYLGRIVESGPSAEIFRAPRHPYTAALLASEPVPDPARRRTAPPVIGEVPSLAHRPPGCEFHPRCPLAQDRCKAEPPAETSLFPGHTIRCHYPLDSKKAERVA
jgi:peptide/nickel transport system ATP-binding protein